MHPLTAVHQFLGKKNKFVCNIDHPLYSLPDFDVFIFGFQN